MNGRWEITLKENVPRIGYHGGSSSGCSEPQLRPSWLPKVFPNVVVAAEVQGQAVVAAAPKVHQAGGFHLKGSISSFFYDDKKHTVEDVQEQITELAQSSLRPVYAHIRFPRSNARDIVLYAEPELRKVKL